MLVSGSFLVFANREESSGPNERRIGHAWSESTVGKRVGKCKTKRQPHSIHPPRMVWFPSKKETKPSERNQESKARKRHEEEVPLFQPTISRVRVTGWVGWGPTCPSMVCRTTDQEDRAHSCICQSPVGRPRDPRVTRELWSWLSVDLTGLDGTSGTERNGTQPTGLVSVVWQVLASPCQSPKQVFDLAVQF